MQIKLLLFHFLFWGQFPFNLIGQKSLPASWKETLSNNNTQQSKIVFSLEKSLMAMPTTERDRYMEVLARLSESPDVRQSVRSLFLTSNIAPKLNCDSTLPLLLKAIEKTILLKDNFLLADGYLALAEKYSRCGPNERAVFFYLKALALRQQAGFENFSDNSNLLGRLAETCYQMEEYNQSIRYARESLDLFGNGSFSGRQFSVINIIGLSYQKLGRYDSAVHWHHKAFNQAVRQTDSAWMGIIKGNWGHTLMLEGKPKEALPLLWFDYTLALQYKDEPSAGNTLQRIARIYLAEGKTDSALLLAKKAQAYISNIKRYYHAQYTMQAALTLSRIYEQKGDGMAAMQQYKIYNRIADSLALVLKKSRFDVVQTQMAFEKTLMQKNELMQAQQYEKKLRFAMATGMLLLGIIGWLLYQRKMASNKKEAEILLQQKKLAEAETEAAKQQLELFTNSLLEKNELIEKLRQQAMPFQPEELIEQSILTEEDWLRFRAMFDKVYPDFFTRLAHLANEATQAEQRMAALIRLGIGNKQMATMLGVSADTVRKSKSRLRQRLQLSLQEDLDQIIGGI
jgi:DNA-binding CsgD family transcriptional regulator